MSLNFRLLLLSLVAAVTLVVSAQDRQISGFVLFDDGERIEMKTDEDMEHNFFRLLDSAKDGRCEMSENGVEVLSMVKKGQEVTVTFQGKTEVSTVSEVKQSFAKARAHGQLTACKSNLKNIATALEMYAVDTDGEYPENLSGLTPDYLIRIPECPASGASPYSYKLLQDPFSYQIQCTGSHESIGVEKGLPAYNSHEGLIEDKTRIKE